MKLTKEEQELLDEIQEEEENELSISDLKFKVESIEEAGELSLKLAKGLGKSLEGTVYESAADIRNKKIEKMNKLGYWLAKEKKMKNKKVFQIVNQHLNKSLLIIFTKYQ